MAGLMSPGPTGQTELVFGGKGVGGVFVIAFLFTYIYLTLILIFVVLVFYGVYSIRLRYGGILLLRTVDTWPLVSWRTAGT